MDLDFDKYCLVERSPTTVLPAPRCHPKVASRKLSGNPKYGNDIPSLNEDFKINFSKYNSESCRDSQSRGVIREGNEVLKRGSIYQSSREVKLLQQTGDSFERVKIEFSQGTANAFSYGIIDSLCNSDEDSSLVEENRASSMSLSVQSTSSVYENQANLCFHGSMIKSEPVAAPLEKDLDIDLHKSLSSKLALPHSPAKSECDGLRASSLRARFGPGKKVLDPFVKSKSHKSPFSISSETSSEMISWFSGINRNRTVCRSLHNEEKESNNSVLQCSPAHLRGLLKLGNKHGMPLFHFSMKSHEDVYVAKTWKSETGSSWVYTFHSLPHRKMHNTTRWGFRESSRELSMVGQMHVSCHLCTEIKGAGESKDFMVTEFVLYDIVHSRRSAASRDNSGFSNDVNIEPSASQSSTAAKLHPELEIAAIVVQVPLEKRESLKFKSGDKKIIQTLPNLLDPFQLGNAKESILDTSSPARMHVVIPAGNHSLPIGESCGPSPLLDRWRLGGACDCGGWDMACPLDIFSSQTAEISEGQPMICNQNPTQLFLQGRKDNIPAFTMRAIEDGKYTVDFHAQLSALQAFSISVAILHAADASNIVDQGRSKQMVQRDSQRVFSEKEIRTMIDSTAEEEKCVGNKRDEVLPLRSLLLDPPFSPISRV